MYLSLMQNLSLFCLQSYVSVTYFADNSLKWLGRYEGDVRTALYSNQSFGDFDCVKNSFFYLFFKDCVRFELRNKVICLRLVWNIIEYACRFQNIQMLVENIIRAFAMTGESTPALIRIKTHTWSYFKLSQFSQYGFIKVGNPFLKKKVFVNQF